MHRAEVRSSIPTNSRTERREKRLQVREKVGRIRRAPPKALADAELESVRLPAARSSSKVSGKKKNRGEGSDQTHNWGPTTFVEMTRFLVGEVRNYDSRTKG